jgi:2'-5' RNA ligase
MRLFVAVWPSTEVLDTIAAFERPDVRGLRWTTPDQWHVTLRFMGECDGDEATAAFLAIEADPVEVTMGPTTGRFGRRILYVPTEGLLSLATATVAATAGVGKPPDPRPFAGHLTLARSRRGDADLGPLAGLPLAGQWTPDQLTLVSSRLDPAGARYEIVESLPLGR